MFFNPILILTLTLTLTLTANGKEFLERKQIEEAAQPRILTLTLEQQVFYSMSSRLCHLDSVFSRQLCRLDVVCLALSFRICLLVSCCSRLCLLASWLCLLDVMCAPCFFLVSSRVVDFLCILVAITLILSLSLPISTLNPTLSLTSTLSLSLTLSLTLTLT